MATISVEDLITRLQDTEPGPIIAAVRDLGKALPGLDDAGFRSAVEGISGLFYIDLFDRADLQPAVDEAETTLASAGDRVVPIVLHLMEGSDFKSHLHLARVLARVGPVALRPLRRLAATADEPYNRAFALYAIGKMRSAEVHEALPEVTGSLMHPDREVRDSAARALGKIVEQVPATDLSERRREEIYIALRRVLSDAQPAVRAKAVRSLGKMARCGYLSGVQRAELRARLLGMAGKGESDEWDGAYIVRREATEALGELAD